VDLVARTDSTVSATTMVTAKASIVRDASLEASANCAMITAMVVVVIVAVRDDLRHKG